MRLRRTVALRCNLGVFLCSVRFVLYSSPSGLLRNLVRTDVPPSKQVLEQQSDRRTARKGFFRLDIADYFVSVSRSTSVCCYAAFIYSSVLNCFMDGSTHVNQGKQASDIRVV